MRTPLLALTLLAPLALWADESLPSFNYSAPKNTSAGAPAAVTGVATEKTAPESPVKALVSKIKDIGAPAAERIKAINDAVELIADAKPDDQKELAYALASQFNGSDKDVRNWAIIKAGAAAENAVYKAERERFGRAGEHNNATAEQAEYAVPVIVTKGLGTEIAFKNCASIISLDPDVCSKLLLSFSRAGARLRTPEGFMGPEVDYFLRAVYAEIDSGLNSTSVSPGGNGPVDDSKTRAAIALDHFLTGNTAPDPTFGVRSRLPGAGPWLLSNNKKDVLDTIAANVLQLAGPNQDRFKQKSPGRPDRDSDFRYAIKHALKYLGVPDASLQF